MITVDQLNREVQIPFLPKRIISLVPSQTELLFDLGLDEEIAGITKFCIHPEAKVKSKIKVGGTKKFNFEKIRSLQPDLIIGNKEENEELQVKELIREFPVWMSDIKNLDDAFAMMNKIGAITGKEEKAENLVKEIQSSLENWNNSKSRFFTGNPSAVYLIWQKPYMTIGSDTFIHTMLGVAGFANLFADKKRYPETTLEEIKSRNPDYILLSSEPYPFKKKHVDELQKYFPDTKILMVDGEMFSWYGSRLLKAINYFQNFFTEPS